MEKILYCPLCHQGLEKIDNTYKCINKHSYDIAKKGFVNLLLANQHHSDKSGDEKIMIEARTFFLDSGKYASFREKILEVMKSVVEENGYKTFSFVDAGCGEGYYTNYIHKELSKITNISTFGVDLSKSAINYCAIRQRQEHLENELFIIGNLMYLPFKDNSVDFLLNSFAKIDETEFLRVVKKGGWYLRVLPGKTHLKGLKEAIYDNVRLNEEKEYALEGFTLVKEETFTTNIILDNKEQIKSLFMMTPYFYKSPKNGVEHLLSLDNLDTEISFNFLLYKKA
jgi:23S rRNA (guanine745-N1)-methyltransferase